MTSKNFQSKGKYIYKWKYWKRTPGWHTGTLGSHQAEQPTGLGYLLRVWKQKWLELRLVTTGWLPEVRAMRNALGNRGFKSELSCQSSISSCDISYVNFPKWHSIHKRIQSLRCLLKLDNTLISWKLFSENQPYAFKFKTGICNFSTKKDAQYRMIGSYKL